MERSTIFNGKIHYKSMAMFNCYVSSPEGKPSYIPWNPIESPLNPIKTPFSLAMSPTPACPTSQCPASSFSPPLTEAGASRWFSGWQKWMAPTRPGKNVGPLCQLDWSHGHWPSENGGSVPLKEWIFPWKMVDCPIKGANFPMKNGGSFHSYVSHYQRLWMAYGSSPADLETLTQQVGKSSCIKNTNL